jgi:hypothetical protein
LTFHTFHTRIQFARSFLNTVAGAYGDAAPKGWWAWLNLVYGVPTVSQAVYDASLQAIVDGLSVEMSGNGITNDQVE